LEVFCPGSIDESEGRGVFAPQRDPARFARLRVAHGTVRWPEDGLDMAPEPPYGEACQHPVSAASTSA
jgi:hypothetical protein